MGGNSGALWRCPSCGHRFVTRNLWHSCGRFRIEDHFRKADPAVRVTYRRLVREVRALGPVTIYAQKTRIVFQVRVRFAGAVVHRTWLEGTMWLKLKAEHPALSRVESFGRLGYGLHFKLLDSSAIDAGFVELLREAYKIGEGRPPSEGTRKNSTRYRAGQSN